MTAIAKQKSDGAYYTPEPVVQTLLRWAIHEEGERFLDPSCGDGRFIGGHKNSVGIEQSPVSAQIAMQRAPWALVHEGDFFAWAGETAERFDAVGGNPPFIRYQTFKGEVRERALALCNRLGVRFSGLASSWAPFLVASTTVLQPGGRMAFVVPAEIGHSTYSAPVLEYLATKFDVVHVVAYRQKLFPELSEDCWLLYAEGFGGQTSDLRFTALQKFHPSASPPGRYIAVGIREWKLNWNRRLRPFLLPSAARELYSSVVCTNGTKRLRDFASVGIGYVSGANGFFHLRPSEADKWKIPEGLLRATVRRAEYLPASHLTASSVAKWRRDDDEVLLLAIPKGAELPVTVQKYLASEEGKAAREGFKCRNRSPWYSVPDVRTPDFFLTYMSGLSPSLVRNDARCTCTNSVHAVSFRDNKAAGALRDVWQEDFLKLSCELEGHPLGGGMLKLEPGEAAQIVVPSKTAIEQMPPAVVGDALRLMRTWRHYASQE